MVWFSSFFGYGVDYPAAEECLRHHKGEVGFRASW